MDICRQSIYFETVADICCCLTAMSKDPEIELARIKNRFDPALKSAESAGYRNIAVNLRVDTPETRALGIESHVCEVQLLIICMAAIKVILHLYLFTHTSRVRNVKQILLNQANLSFSLHLSLQFLHNCKFIMPVTMF